jgi:hypothetical protein
MVTRWAWGSIEPGVGGHAIAIDPYPELFDTKDSARASMQRALDSFEEHSTEAQAAKLLRTAAWSGQELLIVCPLIIAWVIYPVRDGHSSSQAGVFYLHDHRDELTRRMFERRDNSVSGGAGCAVIALATMGALIAGAFGIAQIPWGA